MDERKHDNKGYLWEKAQAGNSNTTTLEDDSHAWPARGAWLGKLLRNEVEDRTAADEHLGWLRGRGQCQRRGTQRPPGHE